VAARDTKCGVASAFALAPHAKHQDRDKGTGEEDSKANENFAKHELCGLTFKLTGPQRQDAEGPE